MSRREHGLDGGGAFPLAETLHGFLGNAQFFTEAVGFLNQELCCGLGRIRALFEHIADVFISVGVGQLDGEIGISAGNRDIDQTRLGTINDTHHSGKGPRRSIVSGILRGNPNGGKKARILIEFEAGTDTLGEGVATDQIHDGIDHVDTANLFVAHLREPWIQNARLILLDKKNGTRPVGRLDLG